MPDPISWEFSLPYYIAAFFLGYLLGSIPFGMLLTRFFDAGDLRKIGSGNIGATNVLRTGRKDLAAATLILDGLKGTAAVLVAYSMWGVDAAVLAGLGAFLGHCFPVWLKFRGGKGVATFIGILLGLYWPAGLCFIAVWIGLAYLFRYSSLSALTASALSPVILWFMDQVQFAELFALLALILWIRHHENIRRLVTGGESKIGSKG